jgi:hypothetical protein
VEAGCSQKTTLTAFLNQLKDTPVSSLAGPEPVTNVIPVVVATAGVCPPVSNRIGMSLFETVC